MKTRLGIGIRNAMAGLVAAGLLFTGSPGVASAGAQSTTFILSDVTETVRAVNPCFGPMVGILTYSGVVHITENGNSYHTTISVHGTAVDFSPTDAFAPFTGHFDETEVVELNPDNMVDVFTVTQSGPPLQFHITFVLVIDQSGAKLQVANFAC
jgi:hypothetical protein